jgi:hypothetical protein
MTVAGLLRRRWPALALVASLVLNGFLIGMIVADSMRPRGGFSGDRLARFELRRFDDRLPKEAVEQVALQLTPLKEELTGRIERLREMREEVMRMAAAPEPDREAIDARLAELRAEASAMMERVQKATYDAVLTLPPEARARLAAPDRS